MMSMRISKAPAVIPMAIPTLVLRVLSLSGMQSSHFLATTEKSENPQKFVVLVILVR